MNKHVSPRKISPILIIVLALLAIVFAILVGFIIAIMSKQPSVSQGSVTDQSNADNAFTDTILLDGVEYELNNNLQTVLLMGIDQTEDDRTSDAYGGGRADFILLAILDTESETTKLLQISRDAIVPVDYYDMNGQYAYSEETHLTLQYAVGNSHKRSCWLMENKVSEILYGIDIDASASLTYDGITVLVDAIGGIEITVPEDYTDIDPRFEKDATILMDGATTMKYIKTRDIDDFGSNNERMARQLQVIRALVNNFEVNEDQAQMISLLQKAATPYMESNVDAEMIEKLSRYPLEEPFLYLPGEDVVGVHDEFHIDEDALRNMVIETFYTPIA